MELGNLKQATHFAERAVTLHETLNDRISLARTENNLGIMLLRHGELAQSRSHFDRSLKLSEEARAEDGTRAALLLSLCELEVAESNLDEAARFAHEALEMANRNPRCRPPLLTRILAGSDCGHPGGPRSADWSSGPRSKSYDSLGIPGPDESGLRTLRRHPRGSR